jgi:hypothetical protein
VEKNPVKDLPFKEEVDGDGWFIRKFSSETNSEELKWHRDDEDREIVVKSSNGWFFQMDDSLPVEFTEGKVFNIKKGQWHRIIAGFDNLIILMHKGG